MKHRGVRALPLYLICNVALFYSPIIRTDAAFQDDEVSKNIAQEYFDLAQACQKDGKKDAAIQYYRMCLERNPRYMEAYQLYGNLLREQDKIDEAIIQYRTGLNYDSEDIMLLMELGNTLNMIDQAEEALECYVKVAKKRPDYIASLHNLAFTLKKLGRNEAALKIFRHVIDAKPDYSLARFNYSAALLSLGHFKEGWEEYEYRWAAYNESPKRFDKPLWDGCDLAGKTILLYAEQGFGDSYQFIRYAKLLKKQGARIIFEVPNALVSIMRLCPYLDFVVASKEQLPDFDYQIPLMSLPLVCKTFNEQDIPNEIPYLYAQESLINEWRMKMSGDKKFKIGLCWHGNARYPTQTLRKAVETKAIPLSLLAEIGRHPNISLYCLQRIDGTEQLKDIDSSIQITHLGNDFDIKNGRFMDTAAVIKNLDLVITIDTSIAHLAGGLGANVWLLLPECADWRWLAGRNDSPWYPGMKLFRQPSRGDWESVMHMIRSALDDLLKTSPAPAITAPPSPCTQPDINDLEAALAQIAADVNQNASTRSRAIDSPKEPAQAKGSIQEAVRRFVAAELSKYEQH